MKQTVHGNDDVSPSALFLAHPNFFVGVRLFAKWDKGKGASNDPGKMVFIPSYPVPNPFVSEAIQTSYGFVEADAPFIMTITAEHLVDAFAANHGDFAMNIFHDEPSSCDDGGFKRQIIRHTLGAVQLVLANGGVRTTSDPIRVVLRIVAERHMKDGCKPVYLGAGVNSLLNTSPCVRKRVYSTCPGNTQSVGLWPLERVNTPFSGAGPKEDLDLKGPLSARRKMEYLSLTSKEGASGEAWGHSPMGTQWLSKTLNEVVGAIDNKSSLYFSVEENWASPEEDEKGVVGNPAVVYDGDEHDTTWASHGKHIVKEESTVLLSEINMLRNMVDDLQIQIGKRVHAIEATTPTSPVLNTPPSLSGASYRIPTNKYSESPRAYSSVTRDPLGGGDAKSKPKEEYTPDILGATLHNDQGYYSDRMWQQVVDVAEHDENLISVVGHGGFTNQVSLQTALVKATGANIPLVGPLAPKQDLGFRQHGDTKSLKLHRPWPQTAGPTDLARSLQAVVNLIVPGHLRGQHLTHSEGKRAWHLFVTAGMEGGASHPGLQYLQIHGLDSSQNPLIWNLGVAHLFHKFASADAVVDLNKRLHELKQKETEGLPEYMARAIPLAADSSLSLQERGKLVLQGMCNSSAKNTFLGAWGQTTLKSFDELRDMALQSWVPTAAVMMSDKGIALSKPPVKWRGETSQTHQPKKDHRSKGGGGDKTSSRTPTGGGGGSSAMAKTAGAKSQACYSCGEAWNKEHKCSKKKNTGASDASGSVKGTAEAKPSSSTKKLSPPESGESDSD